MHFRVIACISSFISQSLDWCAIGPFTAYTGEIWSCQSMPGLLREAALSVCFTLISAWNQKEWMEGEEGIVFIIPKVALDHTWPLWQRMTGAVCIVSRVCHPTLAWCFHGCFHWSFSLKFTSLPIPKAWQFILNRPLLREGAGGPFEACCLPFLFCCLGRFFVGGVTQLCIVFYSLALLRVHPKFGSAESTK